MDITALAVALLALAGTAATGMWGRRSARDTTAVEHRRVDLDVLKASVADLRTMVDRERERSRELEARVEALSTEVHEARRSARRDAAYIDVLLAAWPRPPEPPPRPY